MNRILAVLTICLSGLVCGCATSGPSSRSADAEITQLHLITFPTGINMDAIPGQDGVALKVFAGNSARAKPLPLRQGKLEVLLFDGLLKSASGEQSQPLKIWQFSMEDLRRHEFTSTIGVGYQLTLTWDDAKPSKGRATVMARLLLPDERAVYSAPSPITLGGA